MGRAQEIEVKVIPSGIANPFVKKHHYSGKVVNNSCLHFGVFLDKELHGVMSFGPSLDKAKIIGLVEGTTWNQFLELNRMAFDDYLPKFSESRAISLAIKLIKKNAPQVKWIISFADGCSCGDGTIYRASNFVLTMIKPNDAIAVLPNGEKIHKWCFILTRPQHARNSAAVVFTTSPTGNMTGRHTSKQHTPQFCQVFSFATSTS